MEHKTSRRGTRGQQNTAATATAVASLAQRQWAIARASVAVKQRGAARSPSSHCTPPPSLLLLLLYRVCMFGPLPLSFPPSTNICALRGHEQMTSAKSSGLMTPLSVAQYQIHETKPAFVWSDFDCLCRRHMYIVPNSVLFLACLLICIHPIRSSPMPRRITITNGEG